MQHVKIIDYTQLPYKYVFSPNISPLSTRVNGEVVDTTIPNYTIKEIARLSDFGLDRTAVVFDARKNDLVRSSKLANAFGLVYKDNRKKMPPMFAKGIELTKALLRDAGVSVYHEENHEADDIIYNLAKHEEANGCHVDIFTNDSDLLCLVSDRVTVYYRGAKSYGADTGNQFKGYTIVTPENYQDVCASISAYKGYCIKYNSMYLHKLICGDKADNIPKYAGYGPSKFNDFMGILEVNLFDFRKATPENFDYIMGFFTENFEFTDKDSGLLDHIYKVHEVMKFPKLTLPRPERYGIGSLNKVCSVYNINIPLPR